jgi:UDP-N-acetylmuramate--alanine ligase
MVVMFQPHRYTRTRDLFEDFTQVLSEPDVLVLLDIYSANEEPIVGSDGRALAGAIRNRGNVDPIFVANTADITEVLQNQLKDGDVLLTLGAGSVGTISAGLPAQLSGGGLL